MKKILYGTTALVAAGMFVGASQADAAGVKLNLGGYFTGYGAYVDQDDGATDAAVGHRDHTFDTDAEIYFQGETTLENGITVGAFMALETTDGFEGDSGRFDERYIYIEGGWGLLEFGENHGAAVQMAYVAPGAAPNAGLNSPDMLFHTDVGPGRFPVNLNAGTTINGISTARTWNNFADDSQKLNYFTPRISGIQLGLSYTPDTGNVVGNSAPGVEFDTTIGQQSQVWEMSANYVGKVQDVDVGVSWSYLTSDLEANSAAGGFEDRDAFSFGANLGWNGFTLGGSYLTDDTGTSGNADFNSFDIGLQYDMDAWSFSFAYANAEQELVQTIGGANDEDTLDSFELAASYALAAGVTLAGGIQYWEYESGQDGVTQAALAGNGNHDATVFFIGSSLEF